MRHVFRFGFALALGLALMAGCSDENGEGGSGGMAGSGGEAGTGGSGGMAACERYHACDDDNQCTEDAWVGDTCENTPVMDGAACDDENECTTSTCVAGNCAATPVENGTSCNPFPFADAEGTCIDGTCAVECDTADECKLAELSETQCTSATCASGVCEETPVQNGTPCDADPFDFSDELEGNCFEGECAFPCETDEDCGESGESGEPPVCVQLDGGSRCEERTTPDGTPCPGGTFQLGNCQVTTFDMPCSEQAYQNAVEAGCGPYTFDCDEPTEVWESPPIFHRDVILNGGGYARVEGLNIIPEGVHVELIGFVIAANGFPGSINNFGGELRLIKSTVTNEGGVVGDGEGEIGMLRGSSLILRGCTVLGSGKMELLSDDGDMLIVNSTLSFGSEGGGLSNVSADGQLTVVNSILRSKGVFPVIAVTGDAPPAMVTATIVDGECLGSIDSGGYNIESPGNTCGFDTDKEDQIEVSVDDLKLGPRQNNGGLTETHAVYAGSVAIDVIPEADCVDADEQPLTTDQRGQPRPETGGTMCDVGAFELQP